MRSEIERWRACGATHLSLSTMRAGFSQDDQIAIITAFRKVVSRTGYEELGARN